jgi:hypothetical protein
MGYDSPNLALYRVGVTTPYWSATTPNDDWLESAGLALSPDGRTLYAAVDGAAPGGPALLIDTYALPPAPAQSVSDPCPPARAGSAARPGSGGSAGTQPVRISVSRSGRKITGKLRVRRPVHARAPAAGFVLILALQPRIRGTGYRYTVTLSRLHCAGGADALRISFASRLGDVRCRRHRARWSGAVRLGRRYRVRVTALRTRHRRPPARGRVYSLSLRGRGT